MASQFSNLSAEWLSANLSRAYPLSDDTGGVPGTLPSSLLTDMFIMLTGVPEDVSTTEGYISSITNTGKSVLLSITITTDDDKSYLFSDVVSLTYADGSSDFYTVSFSSSSDNGDYIIQLDGSVTVGLIKTLASQSSESRLTSDATKIFDGLIRKNPITELVRSITINNIKLTGDVVVELADGLSVDYDQESNSMTISLSGYADDAGTIIDDEDILDDLIERYGRPICSINGVYPNADGELSIVTEPITGQDADAVTSGTTKDRSTHTIVAEGGDGPGTIRLKIQSDPCLELDSIERLVEDTDQLNDRAAQLDSAQTALDNAIGSVATQLTRLG